ncbi:hypothetical protein ACIQU5_29140 [Streptomyces sp. NPDC090306]|uniref:hypothetical protein n=1 Tax=Streptomyces sp. NPDC090306 TaxID=3365961 RepID=UPI00381FB53C
MHRTTTTATLLVTVAVSALAGCVTVQRPAASPPVPARPSVPRPEGSGTPRIVQAPASEALGLVGAPRTPAPSKTPAPASSPAGGPAAAGPAAPRHVPPPAAPTSRQPRTRPEGHRPRHRQEDPLQVPEPTRSVTGNADVCALGRAYGGWPADSPQATICRDAYGR